ncbi:protocatechuate 3,4-dioxygenase subunit alpha [Caballeronia fortuita]|uniref:Protocatechuate 3,4-dioxygenase subunit alpha n=1 Tax=Caballeronia fortuita TaxID=1777138 RepID=A0A158DUE9_9BURK|nr:protocatechuate 3,4-dioxygenase subunit alpha [Caballeronia fortuita]SAK98241.1 protocatechuate 3,4-dioxygenase subunit alpha [Caballeronia fortuita]
MTTLKQTPSQTVGPYFAYGLVPEQYNFDLKSLFTASAADREVPGEHISIVGNVFDAEGKPVNDALIEIAQADANGRYVQSVQEARESGFRGFARCGTGTDPKLRFIFDTVKPGATADDSAPHIDVIVLMRGMLLHTYTRIYFDDETDANAKDTVLQSVPAERRHTLIAKCEAGASAKPGSSGTIYRFDINLRGPNETVFFDL